MPNIDENAVFQVIDWNEHYENAKSRTIERCSHVYVPNKQHGEGFRYIMGLTDGLAVYAVFNLILGACSQHHPRHGWLTNTGKKDGKPWTAKSLSMRWWRREVEVLRALEVLSSEQVSWIRRYTSEVYLTDTQTPIEGKGRELKGIESAAHSCPESDKPTSVPDDPTVMTFECYGTPDHWNLRRSKVSQWEGSYPWLNVMAEIIKARQWLTDNPRKKKTARGMPGFLGGWLGRAQNKGGVRRDMPQRRPADLDQQQREEKRRQSQQLAEREKTEEERMRRIAFVESVPESELARVRQMMIDKSPNDLVRQARMKADPCAGGELTNLIYQQLRAEQMAEVA